MRPWTVDEPEASQVPDTTLDSRLMEGITDLEHLAPGVSLDNSPNVSNLTIKVCQCIS